MSITGVGDQYLIGLTTETCNWIAAPFTCLITGVD